MTPRTPAELRAERDRWRAVVAVPRAHGSLETIAATWIVQTLTWALGEAESPAIRGKR